MGKLNINLEKSSQVLYVPENLDIYLLMKRKAAQVKQLKGVIGVET